MGVTGCTLVFIKLMDSILAWERFLLYRAKEILKKVKNIFG